MPTKAKKQQKIIGRIEKVSFPELDLLQIDAKVDTGAYTSSIHCIRIKKITQEDRAVLEVTFLQKNNTEKPQVVRYFHNFTTVKVKSSNGKQEERFKVKAVILIGQKKYKSELTLSNRSKMKYPVLLGRKVLNKRFLVDVSKKYNLGI